jgi:hypothetical protein
MHTKNASKHFKHSTPKLFVTTLSGVNTVIKATRVVLHISFPDHKPLFSRHKFLAEEVMAMQCKGVLTVSSAMGWVHEATHQCKPPSFH